MDHNPNSGCQCFECIGGDPTRPGMTLAQLRQEEGHSGMTQRCEAEARKGTGTGTCDRPLDDRGQCDRAGDHIDTAEDRPAQATTDIRLAACDPHLPVLLAEQMAGQPNATLRVSHLSQPNPTYVCGCHRPATWFVRTR